MIGEGVGLEVGVTVENIITFIVGSIVGLIVGFFVGDIVCFTVSSARALVVGSYTDVIRGDRVFAGIGVLNCLSGIGNGVWVSELVFLIGGLVGTGVSA